MLHSRLFKYSMLIASAVFLFSTTVEIRPAFAITAVMDCKGTQAMYEYQGINYCKCIGGRIVCNKPSGTISSKKGSSGKNTMGMQIIQGAMNNFANAFMNWINSSSQQEQAGPTHQQIAAQQAEWERLRAEWQAKVQKQIGEMETQYLEMEKKKVSESKARLLAGMKGVGTAASGSRLTAMQQLRCIAHWKMALANGSLNNKPRDVLQYTRFIEKPNDEPSITECAKTFPQSSGPSPADNFRSELYESIIEEINLRIPMIEEAKAKQQEAAGKVTEKQQKVDELKNSQAADDLVAAAMKELEEATKLKYEADAGVNRLQTELDILSEVDKTAQSPNSNKL